MLDTNHPDTPFIFQAAAHLDRLKALADDLKNADMAGSVLAPIRRELQLLDALAEAHFPEKYAAIKIQLEAMGSCLIPSSGTGISAPVAQLEYLLGTWAI